MVTNSSLRVRSVEHWRSITAHRWRTEGFSSNFPDLLSSKSVKKPTRVGVRTELNTRGTQMSGVTQREQASAGTKVAI